MPLQKDEFRLIGKGDSDPSIKKRRNDINKFLNSYFKLIVLLLIVAFLWASFSFFIGPKFREASGASNFIIEQRKTDFLKQYNTLQSYKNIVTDFSKIDKKDVYKIEKMVPKSYSRDDLFTEITYFLLQNNFKVNSVNIINPQDEASVTGETVGRRPAADASTQQTKDLSYQSQTSLLSSNIGFWVINLELSDMDYSKIKGLLSLLESNLKIMDVYSLNFYPSARKLNIGILTYYKK